MWIVCDTCGHFGIKSNEIADEQPSIARNITETPLIE